MIKLKFLRIGAYLFLLFSILFFFSKKPDKIEPSIENLLAVLPCASKFEKKGKYWKGIDSRNNLCGYAFLTSSMPPKVKGYGGEIQALVGIDKSGTITGIEILRHSETPFYFGMVEEAGLIRDIKGHRIEDGYKGLSIVSGATISSRAILKDVLGGAAKIAREELNIHVQLEEEGFKKEIILSIITLFIFLSGFTGIMKRKRFFVLLSYGGGMALIGFYMNSPFSLTDISRMLTFHFPSISNLSLLSIYILVILSSFMKKPLYCRCICPYGTLVEIAGMVGKNKKIESPSSARFATFLREFLGIILLSLFLITGFSFFLYLEPFQWFFSFQGSTIMWIFALSGILLSIFIRRFWCLFLCPTGGILDRISWLFNKLPSLLKPQRGS
jgi:uncharacterized membrane protein